MAGPLQNICEVAIPFRSAGHLLDPSLCTLLGVRNHCGSSYFGGGYCLLGGVGVGGGVMEEHSIVGWLGVKLTQN